MINNRFRANFVGDFVIVGFGSIGQGVLPLLLRHVTDANRLTIVTSTDSGDAVAARYGVRCIQAFITIDNYQEVLGPLLKAGGFLLNCAYEVSSIDLIELCQARGCLYLDTNIEPWHGWFTDPARSPSRRSNYALRDLIMDYRKEGKITSTAVLAHGANPGLVAHFVKRAIIDLARDAGLEGTPSCKADWASLSKELGIKTIHIAEHDTQWSRTAKRQNEFVNTWSIGGFNAELLQPAELGWGTHERHFPLDADRHEFGTGSAIYLKRCGALTWVRSWTPGHGPYLGFLTAHGESVSLPDFLTEFSGPQPTYRPSVYFSYCPCDAAVLSVLELAGRNWQLQATQRLMMDDIAGGSDQLGVLLMGQKRGSYWFGSRLSIDEVRRLAPCNNATTLQVTASVLAGVIWAIENPERGIVEPEDMDSERVLEICLPYLGEVSGIYTDWSPTTGRCKSVEDDFDDDDPWQFKNFRIV